MVQATSHHHLRGRRWHNDVVRRGRVTLCRILRNLARNLLWLTNGSRGVNTSTMLARSGPTDLLCLHGIATFSQKMAQLNELNMRIHDS